MRAAALLLLLAAAGTAFAGAEEPALICGCPSGLKRGDTSITFGYQRGNVTRHFNADGSEVSRGRIKSAAAGVAVDYAFTDRLQMSVAVPYISASYSGAFAHPTSLDNGATHSTFQNLRADLRYHMVFGETRVTPYIGYVLPTHDYETLGHAAVGSNLREQTAGINVERSLDRIVPGAYVQGRYAFSFAEKVLGVSHNRSNIDVNVGYFVLPSLVIRGMWSTQKTHGGLDLNLNLGQPITAPQFVPHHDRIARVNYVMVGAGASYALTDSVDVFTAMQKTLNGRNGHKLDWSPSIGLTWSFSTARADKSCAMP